MFTCEVISPHTDSSILSTGNQNGWYGGYSDYTPPEQNPEVVSGGYWEDIAATVQGANPSEALLFNSRSLTESPSLHDPSPDSDKEIHNPGLIAIAGSVFTSLVGRSRGLRRGLTTLALIASNVILPMSSPRQAEANGTLVPIVQQPAGWTCVGEARAREMDPLCETLHAKIFCSPSSAYHIDENGNQIPAETEYSTSSLFGKERCEFTCESTAVVQRPGQDAQLVGHTHGWKLKDVCYPDSQKSVTTPQNNQAPSTTQVTQPPTDNYGTTQTAPPPTEYYGTVQTNGQVIDGQVQSTPSGGDGYCDILFTLNDPDCKTFSLFGQGGGEAQQYQAPAPVYYPSTTEQEVPYAPSTTTGAVEWQAPTTTGDSCEDQCNWVQSHYKNGTPRDPDTLLAQASGNICRSNCP